MLASSFSGHAVCYLMPQSLIITSLVSLPFVIFFTPSSSFLYLLDIPSLIFFVYVTGRPEAFGSLNRGDMPEILFLPSIS